MRPPETFPREHEPVLERARTPTGAFYASEAHLHAIRERVLARSWQPMPRVPGGPAPGARLPFVLLPGALDEPLLALHDAEGRLRCFSNVCTHRGALIVECASRGDGLRCPYHGRRFDLSGRCVSAPGFERVTTFPGERDHLPELPVRQLGSLPFTALDANQAFEAVMEPVLRRLDFLPLDRLHLDPASSRSYEVAAHFALYCENYLEGLHVPFLHPALTRTLDWTHYRTLAEGATFLQIGRAAEGEPAFELPPGHPDAGERVAAYWYFVFPNLMLNFYPWGLSLNVVVPISTSRTRVDYTAWVLDEGLRQRGAGANLHQVELEDEAVVESAARGVRSRLYRGGSYSPAHEALVHGFHRLLAEALQEEEPPRKTESPLTPV